MMVVNLTPHDINFIGEDGTERIYPASGNVARVETSKSKGMPIDGMPTYSRVFGRPHNLPEPKDCWERGE